MRAECEGVGVCAPVRGESTGEVRGGGGGRLEPDARVRESRERRVVLYTRLALHTALAWSCAVRGGRAPEKRRARAAMADTTCMAWPSRLAPSPVPLYGARPVGLTRLLLTRYCY